MQIQQITVTFDDENSMSFPETVTTTHELIALIEKLGEPVKEISGVGPNGKSLYWSQKTGWQETEPLTDTVILDDPLVGRRVISTDGQIGSILGFGSIKSIMQGLDRSESAVCEYPTKTGEAITKVSGLDEITLLPDNVLATTVNEDGAIKKIDVTDVILQLDAETIANIRDLNHETIPEGILSAVGPGAKSIEICESLSSYFGASPAIDLETGTKKVPEAVLSKMSDNIEQCKILHNKRTLSADQGAKLKR